MPRVYTAQFTLTCVQCGATFTAIKSNVRYCSQLCKNRYAEKRLSTTYTLQCSQCGCSFTHRRTTTRYCSKACYQLSRQNKIVLICQHCGKSFTPQRYGGNENQPYCSKRCGGLARRSRFAKICQQCGGAFEVSPAFDHLTHCSLVCATNARHERAEGNRATLICEHCGKAFIVAAGRKYYKYCSRACNRARHGETNIERQVRKALDTLGILYQQEHQVGVYCIDFYLPAYAVALEVDGDYWHGLPSAIERDARRDKTLTRKGITTIRIREQEMNQDVVSLVKQRLAPVLLLPAP